MIRKVLEGKYDENQKFMEVCNRLRAEFPEFEELDNSALKKILSLFWKCTGYWWNDTAVDHSVDEIIDKFYDWFSEYDGVGDLILSTFNSKKGDNHKFLYDKARGMNALSGNVLFQLIKQDPRFQQALVNAAKELGWIDREGHAIYSNNENSTKVLRSRDKATVAQLIQWFFVEGGENTDQEKVKQYLKDHPELNDDQMNIPMDDKTTKEFIYRDRDMYEALMEVIADNFYNLPVTTNSCQLPLGDFNMIGKFEESFKKKYVPMSKRLTEAMEQVNEKKEDKEEETTEEDLPDLNISDENKEVDENNDPVINPSEEEKDDLADMNIQPVPVDNNENSDETMVKENVKSLTDSLWNDINQTKQFISSLDDLDIENKDDMVTILNGFIDDLVINIGMLNKVNDLFNNELAELLDQGKQKASKLIGNSSKISKDKDEKPEKKEKKEKEDKEEDSSKKDKNDSKDAEELDKEDKKEEKEEEYKQKPPIKY